MYTYQYNKKARQHKVEILDSVFFHDPEVENNCQRTGECKMFT